MNKNECDLVNIFLLLLNSESETGFGLGQIIRKLAILKELILFW